MLSRLKKDLGLPVDFKTQTEKREEQRAKDAGWDEKEWEKKKAAEDARKWGQIAKLFG